ncbi:abortive infection family protein [Aggregatibacter actinomycetemcomitans]|uniref:abortive infection family protein n=1 Tax=Aggregatibacter actinomycetemcomitans TaxID=714 RepID=UPI00197C6160|nr:abortive infection family protein [Aggregatibacter actinomycetemcomitans]MBN6080162.1 abortive infection family protein [Aggregatibacter actinomycetemcomitans]
MMNWVLESMDKAPSFQHYRGHIDNIISNVYGNPALSIELCKSVTEGICKTILTDKGESIPEKYPNLVSTTINKLDLSYHKDHEHLLELSKRLGSILHYVAEIRNQYGDFASHGQDIEHKKVTSDLALFVLHSTNAILGFILHFYIVTDDYRKGERIRYEDNQRINELIDESYETETQFKISYSKALFDQDLEAYKELVIEFEQTEYERLMERE